MIVIGSSGMMRKKGGPVSGKEAGPFYYQLKDEEVERYRSGEEEV
jgi:hypothetical protein